MSDHSIVRSVVLVLGLGSSFKMTGQKVFRKPFRKESPNQFRNTRKTGEKLRFLVWKTEKCLALLVFSETALKQQKIMLHWHSPVPGLSCFFSAWTNISNMQQVRG